MEVAVFGGGCFWCTEAVFKMLKGVSKVDPGYAGGHTENPTYYEVSDGETGHAEVIHIEYDPALVKYEDLLAVFFGSHDPSTLNRQGADVGTQYRSVIFYTTEDQKKIAEKTIADINASSQDGKPIVTEVAPLTKFYIAENFHKDYYSNHNGNQYCELVINPKLNKIKQHFANLLTDSSKTS